MTFAVPQLKWLRDTQPLYIAPLSLKSISELSGHACMEQMLVAECSELGSELSSELSSKL